MENAFTYGALLIMKGDADINVSNSGAHADQDVVVRAVSDTYWTDVSGAIAVGTGSAGVGIGADVVDYQ